MKRKVFAALLLMGILNAPSVTAEGANLKAGSEAKADLMVPDVVLVGDASGEVLTAAYADPDYAGKAWQWASVTKQIIAVMVMQEVEAGRLNLDDTLKARLPELAKRRYDKITLRDLLMHTSGLPLPTAFPKEGEDHAAFCAKAPKRKPGEKFVYNNCDTALAAAVLESVTGEPWLETAQTRIFDAAGMSGAGAFTAPNTDPNRITSGRPEKFGAAGAMYGLPEDLITFNAALMRGDLLSKASLETLWTGEPSLGYVALGVWSFSAGLEGCEGRVRLIERRGLIGDIKVRNFIAPDLGRSLVAMSEQPAFEFGEVWTASGPSYTMLSRGFCTH